MHLIPKTRYAGLLVDVFFLSSTGMTTIFTMHLNTCTKLLTTLHRTIHNTVGDILLPIKQLQTG